MLDLKQQKSYHENTSKTYMVGSAVYLEKLGLPVIMKKDIIQ